MSFTKRKLNSGFTLVELLVTITIFVILTGVVLFSQSKFNSTILLTNLAYDTALTIRQAQTYGINIKEFNNNGTGKFLPYGVHFDKTANKSFILFADVNYDSDSGEVEAYSSDDVSTCDTNSGCVSRYNIKRGNYIFDLKAKNSSDEFSVNKLSIIFKRPNPDAIIKGSNDGVNYTEYNGATIILKGVDGTEREVNVQANGLIEVLNQ